MADGGRAEADGWRKVTTYVPGMGTHHVRGGITPAMLTDPNFDRLNPILDTAGLDDVFDPTKPDVFQFDGNGPAPSSSASTTTSAPTRVCRPPDSPATTTGGTTTRGSATARPTPR